MSIMQVTSNVLRELPTLPSTVDSKAPPNVVKEGLSDATHAAGNATTSSTNALKKLLPDSSIPASIALQLTKEAANSAQAALRTADAAKDQLGKSIDAAGKFISDGITGGIAKLRGGTPSNGVSGGQGLPSDKRLVNVPPDILQTDTMTPDQNQQGQVGDCWLISTLDAKMESEEGRQQLKDSIQWDPDKQGYWVTLYENGKPVKELVTQIISDGATANGKPGIVSLYESAIFQKYGWDALDGNWMSYALDKISNQSSYDYVHTMFGFDISDDAMQSGGSADGGVTTASTPGDFSGKDTKVVSAVLDPNSPDQTVKVEIVANHAYEVVDVKNGMIGIRNPWGHNDLNGGGTTNGVVYVNPSTFDSIFSKVTQTEFTGVW